MVLIGRMIPDKNRSIGLTQDEKNTRFLLKKALVEVTPCVCPNKKTGFYPSDLCHLRIDQSLTLQLVRLCQVVTEAIATGGEREIPLDTSAGILTKMGT